MKNYKFKINKENTKIVYIVNTWQTITDCIQYNDECDNLLWRAYLNENNKGFDTLTDAAQYCFENYKIATIRTHPQHNTYIHQGYVILEVFVENENIIDCNYGYLYLLDGRYNIRI